MAAWGEQPVAEIGKDTVGCIRATFDRRVRTNDRDTAKSRTATFGGGSYGVWLANNSWRLKRFTGDTRTVRRRNVVERVLSGVRECTTAVWSGL